MHEFEMTAVDAAYYRELKRILDEAREMRSNKVTDLTEFAARSLASSDRITANLMKTATPAEAIKSQLLWAARDEMPQFIRELQSDPSEIPKHEATLVVRLENAAKMLQTPASRNDAIKYYRKLKKILVESRQMRSDKVTDFTEFATKSRETGEQITIALEEFETLEYFVEELLRCAARDDLPEFIRELLYNPTDISDYEENFIERLGNIADLLRIKE